MWAPDRECFLHSTSLVSSYRFLSLICKWYECVHLRVVRCQSHVNESSISHIDVWMSYVKGSWLRILTGRSRLKVEGANDVWRTYLCIISVTHVNKSCETCEWVMTDCFAARVCVFRSNVSMTDIAHSNESCHTCEWIMSNQGMSHVTPVNASWQTLL